MKRINVILDEKLLEEAMKVTSSKNKSEVIEKSLKLLLKYHKKNELIKNLGRFEIDLDLKKLENLRDE